MNDNYLDSIYTFKQRLKIIRKIEDNEDINLFNAVGMATQEIKHSAFLVWLLDSTKPHKLGNIILNKIIERLYIYHSKQFGEINPKQNSEIINAVAIDKKSLIALTDVNSYDVMAEVVTNEDKRIDILLNIRETQTVIVIENKIFTKSHDDQLINYQNYIESISSGFNGYKNKIYIYLSPKGELPINFGGDENYNDKWCVFDYEQVFEVIKEILSELKEGRYTQLVRERRKKLIFLLEDYAKMLKTNVLMENSDLLSECKKILDDKEMREAFELLTLYSHTATEDKVIFFVRAYLDAVQDNSKQQRYFFTKQMQDFFELRKEKINYHLCRCVCQPTGAAGGIVGIEILIGLEKIEEWTPAQEEILTKLVSGTKWKNQRFVTLPRTRVELLTQEDRGRLFEEVKPVIETNLLKFKEILNSFEKTLSELNESYSG